MQSNVIEECGVHGKAKKIDAPWQKNTTCPRAYFYSNFVLTFDYKLLANFERPVLSCIDAEFLQVNTRLNSYLVRKEIEKKGHGERLKNEN